MNLSICQPVFYALCYIFEIKFLLFSARINDIVLNFEIKDYELSIQYDGMDLKEGGGKLWNRPFVCLYVNKVRPARVVDVPE